MGGEYYQGSALPAVAIVGPVASACTDIPDRSVTTVAPFSAVIW
jgi:hypothetical protein